MLKLRFGSLVGFSFIFVSLLGYAAETPEKINKAHKYLFTVSSDAPENRGTEWDQKICLVLHGKVAEQSITPPLSVCENSQISEVLKKEIEESKATGEFQYQLLFHENSDHTIRFTIINHRQDRDDTDFQKAGWILAANSEEIQMQDLTKLIRHLTTVDQQERAIKEMVLVNGIEDSENVMLGSNGEYYSKKTYRKVEFKDAYNTFKEENIKHKNFLRASIEIIVLNGLGGALPYYTLTSEENSRDWDYKGWSGFRKKMSNRSAIRFDTNEKMTNIGHAFAGFVDYTAARSNGLNRLESFLLGFAASTVWEYFAEVHERVSINDEIVTPVGGMVIGEVYYQFGKFFNSGSNTLPNRILKAIFGGPNQFNAWIEKQNLPQARNVDEYGFNADVWHQFSASIGYGLAETGARNTSSSGLALELDLRLFSQKTYNKEGKIKEFMKDTAYVQFKTEGKFGEDAMSEIDALMKLALAGYYSQNTERDEKERLNGYSFFVGPTMAASYSGTKKFGNVTDDWMGVINVLGSTMDLVVFVKDVRIQMTVDIYGDFAMVRSYAIDDYFKKHGKTGVKAILADQGYYYGMGTTSSGSFSVSYKGFEVGTSAQYQTYRVIDGFDRREEELDDHTRTKDNRLNLKTWISHPLYKKNVKMVYSYEHITREGSAGEIKRTEHANRYLGKITFLF